MKLRTSNPVELLTVARHVFILTSFSTARPQRVKRRKRLLFDDFRARISKKKNPKRKIERFDIQPNCRRLHRRLQRKGYTVGGGKFEEPPDETGEEGGRGWSKFIPGPILEKKKRNNKKVRNFAILFEGGSVYSGRGAVSILTLSPPLDGIRCVRSPSGQFRSKCVLVKREQNDGRSRRV